MAMDTTVAEKSGNGTGAAGGAAQAGSVVPGSSESACTGVLQLRQGQEAVVVAVARGARKESILARTARAVMAVGGQLWWRHPMKLFAFVRCTRAGRRRRRRRLRRPRSPRTLQPRQPRRSGGGSRRRRVRVVEADDGRHL